MAARRRWTFLATAEAYLESGRSLEATSRSLFVHPNTVRYRLGRIEDLTHFDLTQPRDAWAARIALALGRLSDAERATRASPRPQLEETSKPARSTS